ncbi:phage terminase small subunit [Stenotrophomonas sp.]|uniref:phage terminase small subunit n=1 Tax=Stenotrophomonas sp. TaxID=69392 RepID=UPI0028AA3116|nr:phage terminase small subunit [Stenotrophomonas sp.]
MADSPAKRHLQRQLAAKAASKAAGHQLMPGTGIYEQMLLQLASDRARLKNIQSTTAKCQLKAELLPAYGPYLDGVLAEGNGAADEVVTTAMLWHIDAGSYVEAMRLAEYVLRHNLPMPDRFERTTGTVVAEEVADAALNALRSGAEFDASILQQACALTDDQDMPDQVRAKLLLSRARWIMHDLAEAEAAAGGEPPHDAIELTTTAVEALRRAIQLHDGCGGKTDLGKAESRLKKYTDSANS